MVGRDDWTDMFEWQRERCIHRDPNEPVEERGEICGGGQPTTTTKAFVHSYLGLLSYRGPICIYISERFVFLETGGHFVPPLVNNYNTSNTILLLIERTLDNQMEFGLYIAITVDRSVCGHLDNQMEFGPYTFRN